MIKKKTEFKLVSSRVADAFERAIARATLDGWYPSSPMIHEQYSGAFELLMYREVKGFSKDKITEMILLDFKDLVGSVTVKDIREDMLLPRRTAIQNSKKVDDFVTEMSRLYDCSGTIIRDILLANLDKTTWVDEEDE